MKQGLPICKMRGTCMKKYAYGIDVSAEEIRTTETETLKTTVREKAEVR